MTRGTSAAARNPDRATAGTPRPIVRVDEDNLWLSFGDSTIQSCVSVRDPDRLVLDYTRTMMGFLLFLGSPEQMAMVGLGGGSLARYCHAKIPGADFTTIEISPDIIALRDTFGIPDDGARFRVVCEDGAGYFTHRREAFDVVLIDGFDRSGQPAALCSLAFYADCRAALRPGGVLVVNLCSDDTFCRTYVDRIGTAFDGHLIAVDADEGENRIVFAFRERPPAPTLQYLSERLRMLEHAHPDIDLARTAQKVMQAQAQRRTRR